MITEHYSMVNRPDVPEELRMAMRTAYGKAARVLAVSSHLRDRIRQHTGIEAQIVPNMMDTSVFTLSPVHKPGEVFRFASAGNLYPVKGFDILLEAMAILKASGERCSLIVMGDGDQETSLKQQSARLGLEETVRFTGRLRREEMAEIYRMADAFVLASRSETFGVAFIEAMATGLPVVGTRCGGPEEFVNADNGILAAPEDPAALAEAMRQMIRTREMYDGAAISAFVRDRYSPSAG